MKQIQIFPSITTIDSHSLKSYLNEVSRIPCLTPEEEANLASLILEGGKEGRLAKERLVVANLRFVISIAKMYQHAGMLLEDLINEGNIGLSTTCPKLHVALIGIDDFAKVELRTAKILECEPVKKSKKLLKLTLDDGSGTRTVASGISQYYKPEELIGHTVIIAANLKPAKLCGVESQGMILAADCPNGDVKVIFTDDIPAGSKIR